MRLKRFHSNINPAGTVNVICVAARSRQTSRCTSTCLGCSAYAVRMTIRQEQYGHRKPERVRNTSSRTETKIENVSIVIGRAKNKQSRSREKFRRMILLIVSTVARVRSVGRYRGMNADSTTARTARRCDHANAVHTRPVRRRTYIRCSGSPRRGRKNTFCRTWCSSTACTVEAARRRLYTVIEILLTVRLRASPRVRVDGDRRYVTPQHVAYNENVILFNISIALFLSTFPFEQAPRRRRRDFASGRILDEKVACKTLFLTPRDARKPCTAEQRRSARSHVGGRLPTKRLLNPSPRTVYERNHVSLFEKCIWDST